VATAAAALAAAGTSNFERKEVAMKHEWMNLAYIGGTVMYALIGVVIFWVTFIVIDKITPYKLWEEIVEHRNLALAIVVAAMCISIGIIVAAAIH
jgi:putative membrane protein